MANEAYVIDALKKSVTIWNESAITLDEHVKIAQLENLGYAVRKGRKTSAKQKKANAENSKTEADIIQELQAINEDVAEFARIKKVNGFASAKSWASDRILLSKLSNEADKEAFESALEQGGSVATEARKNARAKIEA